MPENIELEDKKKKTAPRSRTVPKALLYLLSLPLVCGLLCGGLKLVQWIPQYVELDISPPNRTMGWWSTERSTFVYDDGSGLQFLWRQEISCSKHDCPSIESIKQYFDAELERRGWTEGGYYSASCLNAIPETELLEDSAFVGYVQKEHLGEDCHGPDVCLAVYPSEGSDNYFDIVLGSSNPDIFDDWFCEEG
jgi:hypothetical protein